MTTGHTRRRSIAFVIGLGAAVALAVPASTQWGPTLYQTIFTNWVIEVDAVRSVRTVKFVNSNGAVAGTARDRDSGAIRSYVWTLTDGFVDLGTLGGPSATIVGLNDNRVAAGNSTTVSGGPTRAFRWTKSGGLTDLGTLGGSFAEVTAMNDHGWIVGRSETADATPVDDDQRAFVWTPAGGLMGLPYDGCLTPVVGSWSGATAVSNSGLVAGYNYNVWQANDHFKYRAVLWDLTAQTCTELIDNDMEIERTAYSKAEFVTNSGWVAGRFWGDRTSLQPGDGFVWSAASGLRIVSGGITDLNEDGWATTIVNGRGILLIPGQADVDLGPLLPPLFVLDNHLVVGTARDANGRPHTFVLDPQTCQPPEDPEDPPCQRLELDRRNVDGYTDSSRALGHRGGRFVGINQVFREGSDPQVPEFEANQLFVWDGLARQLMHSGHGGEFAHVSMQIGTSGFIAANVNDGLNVQGDKVWAPPLPSFGFTGFKRPIEGTLAVPGSVEFNKAKPGSIIKVRFDLNADLGPEVLAWGYPRVLPADCITGAVPPRDTTEGVGQNLPQAPPVAYKVGPDRYTLTWTTDASLANTCKALEFGFIDGGVGRALFDFR